MEGGRERRIMKVREDGIEGRWSEAGRRGGWMKERVKEREGGGERDGCKKIFAARGSNVTAESRSRNIQRPDCQSPSSLSLPLPPSFSILQTLGLNTWLFPLRLSLDHTFLLVDAAFECWSLPRDVMVGGKVSVQGDQGVTTSVTTPMLTLILTLQPKRCINHFEGGGVESNRFNSPGVGFITCSSVLSM